MKKTPFGAFLTPALTGRPPAEIRIGLSLLPKRLVSKRSSHPCGEGAGCDGGPDCAEASAGGRERVGAGD